jgi:hypothetical protein
MSLPWKPIAELPVAPDLGREFLCTGRKTGSEVLKWSDARGHWLSSGGFVFCGNPGSFTHFIEVTPP